MSDATTTPSPSDRPPGDPRKVLHADGCVTIEYGLEQSLLPLLLWVGVRDFVITRYSWDDRLIVTVHDTPWLVN